MFQYTDDLRLLIWVVIEKWINEDGEETDTVFGLYNSKETAEVKLKEYFEKYKDEFVVVPADKYYDAHYSPNGSRNNMFFVEAFAVEEL